MFFNIQYLKKILLFTFLPVLISLVSSCSVTDQSGIIMINNYSDSVINNIKIGDTIIACSVLPGCRTDYYYYSALDGSLTADNCITGIYDGYSSLEYEGTFSLPTAFWVTIDITPAINDTYIMITQVKRQGYDKYTHENEFIDDFYSE